MTLDASTTEDDERVYVDRRRAERGPTGPFHVACADDAGRERWGLACGHRGSLDTAMDTMDRIQSTECDNRRKPDEWDAAHE